MTAFRSGFVAVVGPANAGKSTLVNRIVGEKISIVSPKAQTTRNRILGIKSTAESQLILVDTPGYLAPLSKGKSRGALELALRTVSSESVTGVDQVLLVIDGERAVQHEGYLDSIIAGTGGVAPHVIAINKIDLVEKLKLLPLFERLSLLYPERSVELVPISARSGDGIEVLEQLLISRLPEAPAAYPEDQVTDATERFLAGELWPVGARAAL
jgi:GTP-binding protein Era